MPEYHQITYKSEAPNRSASANVSGPGPCLVSLTCRKTNMTWQMTDILQIVVHYIRHDGRLTHRPKP